MPNRNRSRGDYFERRTQDALQADGWIVVRAAGSFGVADLVALKAGRSPRLISCKVHYQLMRRREALELVAAAEKAGADPLLAWSVKPGWVGLRLLTRHGDTQLPPVHMPPARKPAPA